MGRLGTLATDWSLQDHPSRCAGGLMLLMFLAVIPITLVAQSSVLPGQATVQGAMAPSYAVSGDTAASGWPEGDPFDRSDVVLERPLRHLVRQMTDGSSMGSPLPLPAPAQFQRFQESQPSPWSIDYVFMPRSNVEGATEGVIYNEIGFDYLWAHPCWGQSVFLFRPAFDVVFFTGPGPTPEIPAQVYKVAFDLQFDIPINETLGVSIGLTPGLWTDFIVVDGNDFRLPARLLLTFRVNETLFVAGGVIYTDNIFRNVLPGIGVIWDPTSQWHLELLYPRSRLVYNITEDWGVYFAFERGGTTYNIRTQGQDEDMQYRDLRAMIGLEVRRWSAINFFVEAGGAWDRLFRFDIQPNASVSDSFLLRVGARF